MILPPNVVPGDASEATAMKNIKHLEIVGEDRAGAVAGRSGLRLSNQFGDVNGWITAIRHGQQPPKMGLYP
jgi:hypothetical protein